MSGPQPEVRSFSLVIESLQLPRYTFHLHNDLETEDLVGKVFPDLASAKAHATAQARLMVSFSADEYGKIDLRHFISVRDIDGSVLAMVRFEDAVQFVREGKPV